MIFGGMNTGVQSIPESYASRLNAQFIPAGILGVTSGKVDASNPWRNLLAYGPGEEIDPYGAASPNRAGAGLEGDWKFFHGLLEPRASAEFFQEMDNVGLTDTAGLVGKPFGMTRYRVGLEVDLEPWLGWPIRFGGGTTMTDSSNGQVDAFGDSYDLSTSTMEGSVDWRAGKPWGLSLGYRTMGAKGQNEIWTVAPGLTATWDQMGGGIWWRPQDSVSLDVNYTSGHSTLWGQGVAALEMDEFVARVTMEF